MRLSSFLAANAAGVAASAFTVTVQAAPFVGPVSSVEVVVGTELADKAPAYGQRDLDQLAVYLRKAVREELEHNGRLAAPGQRGSKVILVLKDAKPNRPTMQQLSAKPGLTTQSVSVGGASIGGEVLSQDGARTPIAFRWYEQDIRNELSSGAWNDAEHAFDTLAKRLAAGEAPLLD